MGLDDELYLQKIELEKKAQQKARRGHGHPKSTTQAKKLAFPTCPNCCKAIGAPLSSGRQMCRGCGWIGNTVSPKSTKQSQNPPLSKAFWSGFTTPNLGRDLLSLVLGLAVGVCTFKDKLFPPPLVKSGSAIYIATTKSKPHYRVQESPRVRKPAVAPFKSEISIPKVANIAHSVPRPTAKIAHDSLSPDLALQVRSGALTQQEAELLASGQRRLASRQRFEASWPTPNMRPGATAIPTATSYPTIAQTPRRPSVTRFSQQSAIQAQNFVTQACGDLLSWGCEGSFDGQSLNIIVKDNLSTCLGESHVCPGNYSKRGVVRELYSIQRKAENIAPGLIAYIYVDGQMVNLW